MKRGQPLGLDELMIVNPGPPGAATFLLLGDDGALYQVAGLGQGEVLQGRFFLSDNGALYQVQGFGLNGALELDHVSAAELDQYEQRGFGRFFLGEDGALYEIVGSSGDA